MIDRPAPLEINRKISTMGGGRFSLCQKSASLFVQRLSVFLFFRELQKIRPPARKKKLEENSGPDHLTTKARASKRATKMKRVMVTATWVAGGG